MAYFGSTQSSSVANPPRQLISPFATNPAIAGSTNFLSTQASTSANNSNAPGGGGGGLWYYASTNATTDLTVANFFSDAFYLGMRAGDIVMGAQFSSAGSSVVTFMAAVAAVSTAGASLSTGSLVTSTN
jgi:hypothetical protein